MDPQVWGPKAWFFIHNVPLNYPSNPTEEDKSRYKAFFLSLQYILPCSICQNHLRENINVKELDEALKSKVSLLKWTVELHNKVNKQLGKKVLTFDEALVELQKEYSNFQRDKQFKKAKYYIFILLFLLCLIVIFCLFKSKKLNTRNVLPL
ncbi:MAG: hypothetical protein EBV03_14255 [Proteobacteria bacterium]|nr:hypothetical protein [Pseudomonadota bacterium]